MGSGAPSVSPGLRPELTFPSVFRVALAFVSLHRPQTSSFHAKVVSRRTAPETAPGARGSSGAQLGGFGAPHTFRAPLRGRAAALRSLPGHSTVVALRHARAGPVAGSSTVLFGACSVSDRMAGAQTTCTVNGWVDRWMGGWMGL